VNIVVNNGAYYVLPAYRFIEQLCISRKKFDYKFCQQKIRYMPKIILLGSYSKEVPIVYFL
jgi:hypothetical protein